MNDGVPGFQSSPPPLAATPVAGNNPQACPHCGYDLTGDVSGRCPQCQPLHVSSGTEPRCTICDRVVSARWAAKSPKRNGLFGALTCRRCRNQFASRRQAAFVVDGVILIVVGYVGLRWLLDTLIGVGGSPFLSVTGLILAPFLGMLLIVFKDGFGGRSPGKLLADLQVVHQHTREPIGLGRSFLRNFLFVVPLVLFVILPVLPVLVWAGIEMAAMHKGQRLGDRIAKTCVIWLRHKHKAPFSPDLHVCHGCGYDLTGNVSGRCPECGREVPPELLGG